MPRAEAGSAKAIGNAIKAKGLTKLRFYCQICQKACRDENGYKCHVESETHMRQIAALGSNSGKVIDNFSKEFQDGFVSLLGRRFGTARINANKVYQEYIQDRHHLHMNATKWVTLSEFVKHLGREGIAHVEEITDEGQFGWYVTWIDNSPAALARQDALKKMGRAKVDEEGRMRKHLDEQIQRARAAERSHDDVEGGDVKQHARVDEGLKLGEDRAPLKIGIALGKASKDAATEAESRNTPSSSSASASISSPHESSSKPASIAPAPFKMANNPFKAKAPVPAKETAKLGNAFKSSSTSSMVSNNSVKAAASSQRGSSGTAAERIMAEEQAMQAKRKLMGPQPSAKRMRM